MLSSYSFRSESPCCTECLLLSAPRIPRTRTGVGPSPAFAVHPSVAIGGAFFGRAAVVLGFDAALFLCRCTGAVGVSLAGFFACGVRVRRCARQAQSDAGAQQGAEHGAVAVGSSGSRHSGQMQARERGWMKEKIGPMTTPSCHVLRCLRLRANPRRKPPKL